jgi:flavin-dependent dehydrogenase
MVKQINQPPTPRRSVWDVIIIGAGPAGCSAAIALTKMGSDVLLIDAKKFPRRKACGGCLNAVSVGLMEQLLPASTAQDLWNDSIALKEFHVYHNQRSIPMAMDQGGFAVDRAQMDYVLVEHAKSLGTEFLSPAKAKLAAWHPNGRHVEVTAGGAAKTSTETLTAKAVIIACGLGNHAAGKFDQFQQTPAQNSRLGVEAIFDTFPSKYQAGALSMAIGSHGYVGLTHIGSNRLHVAAAVDRVTLQELGPQAAVENLMQQSGAPPLTQTDVTWRGTPPLTARATSVAGERIFVIGDAAGYVEPFTGEGIRWALENGIGVATFAAAAARTWHPQIAADYHRWYQDTITARQKLCRSLAQGLRRSSIRWAAHQALRLRPSLADSIIKRLNS